MQIKLQKLIYVQQQNSNYTASLQCKQKPGHATTSGKLLAPSYSRWLQMPYEGSALVSFPGLQDLTTDKQDLGRATHSPVLSAAALRDYDQYSWQIPATSSYALRNTLT